MCSTVLAWGYSSGLLALRFVKSSFCVLKGYWSSKTLPSQALAFCYFSSPIRTSLSSSKLSCFLWFEYIAPSRSPEVSVSVCSSPFRLIIQASKKTSVTMQTCICPLLFSVYLIVVSGQLTFVSLFSVSLWEDELHDCWAPLGILHCCLPRAWYPARYHQRSLDWSNESIGDQPEKYWLIEWMISFAS